MKVLRACDYVERPWKNGSGVTRAIYTVPEGAGYDTFVWQLSAALVASDGPFSAFPGVDRTLALLSEGELELTGLGDNMTLSRTHAPLAFAGEAPVVAKLRGAPVRDFNVMTQRAVCRHTLVREPLNVGTYMRKAAGVASFLFLEEGSLRVQTDVGEADMGAEDTLLLEPSEVCTLTVDRALCFLWGNIETVS